MQNYENVRETQDEFNRPLFARIQSNEILPFSGDLIFVLTGNPLIDIPFDVFPS